MAKKPPKNSEIDKRVRERQEMDLAGFTEKYEAILEKRQAQYELKLRTTYRRISTRVTAEIQKVYDKLQDANGVALGPGQAISAAKQRNMDRQIRHLEKLQAQLADILRSGGQQKMLENDLAFNYAEGYYFSAFGLEQTARVSIAVPVLTQSHVMGVLANPWLPDGQTYSDRLRANTDHLAKKMTDALIEATGSGWGWNRLARKIQESAGESYYNAVRLARTERRRAAGQAQNHLYMQNADLMGGKRWNAVLDMKTAPKDADNDGKIYQLDYDTPEWPGLPGERIPNHPNCRCKWTPVLSALGVSTRERISKDENGKRMYTKARTYREYAKERGFPDLDERLGSDNPASYLRRGETMDAYGGRSGLVSALPKPSLPKTPKPKQKPAKNTPAIPADTFVEAKTVAEANAWAKVHLPRVKEVDYKGYDIRLANEVNKEMGALMKTYPEVEDINFLGTIQKRNKLQYEAEIAEFIELNAEIIDQIAAMKGMTVREYAGTYVKRRTAGARTMGEAANSAWGDRAGITFNQKYAKDYEVLSEATSRSARTGFHPIGTEKPVSVLVHEFGHSIDYFLDTIGLRDKYVTPITKAALADKGLAKELSEYATYNDREVVAEAFAEYRLNPNPRKYARKIGEAIEQALDEYRKGKKP